MGIEVMTISTCEACGHKHTREGAEANIPPVGWASVNVVIRLDGQGWTHNDTTDVTVCSSCVKKVIALLKSV